MWFWRRPRRLPPSLLLPSLDRLAELIEGVVARLDQVAAAPEPAVRAPEPEVAPPPVQVGGYVLFVSTPDGYRLFQREGAPPGRGAALALDDGVYLVLRLGPSPLPGDRRRCAFLGREAAPLGNFARSESAPADSDLVQKEAREEPSGEARTPDA